MRMTIDDKVCLRHKMSPEEVLVTLMHRQVRDPKEVTDNLVGREILVLRDGKYYITQHWSDVVDEILCDSSGKVKEVEDFYPLALKMMAVYPQGKVPGTAYYYKCNKAEIAKKLQKFFLQYGSYTDDEIVDATKRYVASFNGNYRFLKLIKYFISKNEVEKGEDGENHVVEHSYLADYLENRGEESQDRALSDDWMFNVVN